jgi:hypothetical protein
MPEDNIVIPTGTEPQETIVSVNPPLEKTIDDTPTPSIQDIITKMEATTKAQMELMEQKYKDQMKAIQDQLDAEKLKQMTEFERTEHLKRLEIQKQAEKEQMLVQQIQELQAEKIKAINSEFIQKTISEKPYLKPIIEKMKITDPDTYERYVKPMEETYKQNAEMQNYMKTNTNRNVFSPYESTTNGNMFTESVAKDKEVILRQKAQALLDSII